MVGVKMRNENRLNLVQEDSIGLEGNERGSAAVDKEVYAPTCHMEAGVEPSSTPERITAPYKLYPHVFRHKNPDIPAFES